MAAVRSRVNARQRAIIIDQLRYWRGVRLDNPSRKSEALHHIDNLLDELLEDKERNGS